MWPLGSLRVTRAWLEGRLFNCCLRLTLPWPSQKAPATKAELDEQALELFMDVYQGRKQVRCCGRHLVRTLARGYFPVLCACVLNEARGGIGVSVAESIAGTHPHTHAPPHARAHSSKHLQFTLSAHRFVACHLGGLMLPFP